MSTPNPTGSDFNYYDNNKKSDSKSKLVPYLIGGCLLLLATNLFQFVSNNKKQTQIVQLTQDVTEETKLKDELEKQYAEANVQLEEMKGTNSELNTLIDKQKEELSAQKDKISGLIANKKDLANARAELSKMRTQMTDYIAQIDDLKKKNNILTDENKTLTTDKVALQENVSKEKAAREEVTSQKEQLANEKAKVEAEKKDYQIKASVLKFQGNNSELRGIKVKSNGKTDFDNNPDYIHILQVNFTPLDNAVVKSGKETFYIAVYNTTGEVVNPVVENDPLSDKTIKFTFKKTVDYSGGNRVSMDFPLGDGNKTSLMQFLGTKSKKDVAKCSLTVFNKGYESGKISLLSDFEEKKMK
jgi:myosin heavy subunit